MNNKKIIESRSVNKSQIFKTNDSHPLNTQDESDFPKIANNYKSLYFDSMKNSIANDSTSLGTQSHQNSKVRTDRPNTPNKKNRRFMLP